MKFLGVVAISTALITVCTFVSVTGKPYRFPIPVSAPTHKVAQLQEIDHSNKLNSVHSSNMKYSDADNKYVDTSMNEFLRLQTQGTDPLLNRNYKLRGGRLRRDAEEHALTNSSRYSNETEVDFADDVVDLKRPVAMRRGFALKKPTTVTAEIAFVVDQDISKRFGFSKDKIQEYMSLMLNSVNNRFSIVGDPKITFKLVGLHVIKNKAEQPFIETSKNGAKGYTIQKVLDNYGAWVYKNKKILPAHDMIPLITSIKSDSPATGVAFLKGACWDEGKGRISNTTSSSMSTSVVLDDGKTWSGAFTLAHELAHNLGSPHDAKDGPMGCKWSEGFLMSYEGFGGPNKFHFSKCSKEQMKIFIESTGGACLWSAEAKTYAKPVAKDIGEVLDLNEHCRRETGNPNATVLDEDSADDYCKRIECRTPGAGVSYKTTTYMRAPGDKTPCGVEGRCIQGACANNKESPKVRLDMNKLCIRKANNPAAKLVIADTGEEQCQNLKCQVQTPKGKGTFAYNIVPRNGSFPCGKGGVCQAGKCVGNKENPLDRLDLVKTCVKKTGNPKSKPYGGTAPKDYCKLLKCEVPVTGGVKVVSYKDYVFPENSYPCGDGGKCVKKQCTGESPDRFDMNKVCKKKVGNPNAGMNTAKSPEEQCKKLLCEFPDGKAKGGKVTRGYSVQPMDGSFPCGQSGVCKGGICVQK